MSADHSSLDEKKGLLTSTPAEAGYTEGVLSGDNEDFEVFKKTKDGVDFRTVGRPRAAIIFLKGSDSSDTEY